MNKCCMIPGAAYSAGGFVPRQSKRRKEKEVTMSTKPHKIGNGKRADAVFALPYMGKGVSFFDLFCAALTTLCDIASLPSCARRPTRSRRRADGGIPRCGWRHWFVPAHHRRRGQLLYVRHRAYHGCAYRYSHAPATPDHLLRLDHTYYITKVGQTHGPHHQRPV